MKATIGLWMIMLGSYTMSALANHRTPREMAIYYAGLAIGAGIFLTIQGFRGK